MLLSKEDYPGMAGRYFQMNAHPLAENFRSLTELMSSTTSFGSIHPFLGSMYGTSSTSNPMSNRGVDESHITVIGRIRPVHLVPMIGSSK